MAMIDLLSEPLRALMTAYGEHNQPEQQLADPEGNALPHRHNRPKEMHRGHLYPYQAEMADEEGLREFNSMQKFKGIV